MYSFRIIYITLTITQYANLQKELEWRAMITDSYRKEMKRGILGLFQPLQWVRAIWEGGSAATGYLDDYSDLDLALVVEDDRVEEAFRLFEEYLENRHGINSAIRLPEPVWHGHSQCFYMISDCPPLYYIDLVIEKLSSGNRLDEPDRHGEVQIWLNRDNILHPEPTPPDITAKNTASFLRRIEDSIPLLVIEIRKQIARKKHIDAVSQYHRFITGRLAGLLNLKYRPAMFDFGIRYAERAYPPQVNEELEKLLYISTFDDIEPALDFAVSWTRKLLAELAGIGM